MRYLLLVFALALLPALPAHAQQGNALNAVEVFRDAGFPIDEVYVYTEAKGALLGRPGQYVEKVVWHDARLPREVDTDGDLRFDGGGTIERFTTRADLVSRLRYLEAFDGTILDGHDYRFEVGLMLLRLPFALTPAQAEEYRAVLAGA